MKHAILPYYNAISLYRTTHPMLIEKRQKPTTATVIKQINQDNNKKQKKGIIVEKNILLSSIFDVMHFFLGDRKDIIRFTHRQRL